MSQPVDYTKKFAISQSSLKDWKIMSPIQWYKTWVTKELKRPEKKTTTLGSFLDCLRLTPTEVDKRFIVATCPLPSDKVRLILDEAFAHVETLNKNAKLVNADPATTKKIPLKKQTLEDKEFIMSLCQKHDHYSKQPERAYEDVLKKGTDYFEFIKTLKGRKVITPEENLLAIELNEILGTNPISKPFFFPANKNCEVVFQQQIFAEHELSGFENVEFLPTKGMIDIAHFNHKRKEFREVDLKYTDSVYPEFFQVIRLFDYVGQHSFYDVLVREWLKTYKDGAYKDYAVMPPLNVVIDGIVKTPYIYMYNPDDLYIKRFGIEGTPIRGWEDDINDIAWHFDKGAWSRPREHILNGYITVKIFNKK